MRLGVLDIGSNSAQLQIVQALPGAPPLPVHAVKTSTLLGEAIGDDGCLEEAGIERVCQAVSHTLAAAHRYEVEQLYPFVTAYLHSDPPRRRQVRELRHFVRDTLSESAERLRWEG
ncbi:hypothetical protein G6038_30645, partial [Rhodococcus sp. 14C212]|nr:hypothetical protein [Rhodococcus sp. 14C212]